MGNPAAGWTPERRAKQREAIQRWKPWEKSTGPKTAEGKAKTARNGYKGGKWRQDQQLMKELHRLLRSQRELVRSNA
ncbi:hypothetical protein EJO68_33370 [Variovorax atrisoli]|nr:hypothetical protein EJO68_33370 [Variovorax sp. 369]